MSRETKFRCWDKRMDIMVYQLPDGYRLGLSGEIQVVGHDFSTFRVSEEFTLMQYTGLKDRDGVGVYEGDITESEDRKRRYVVTYREESAKYVLAGIGKAWWIHDMQPAIVSMKVIGNIWENKELLK